MYFLYSCRIFCVILCSQASATPAVGSLEKFIDALVAAIRLTPQYWRDFAEYFGLLVSGLIYSPASCTLDEKAAKKKLLFLVGLFVIAFFFFSILYTCS